MWLVLLLTLLVFNIDGAKQKIGTTPFENGCTRHVLTLDRPRPKKKSEKPITIHPALAPKKKRRDWCCPQVDDNCDYPAVAKAIRTSSTLVHRYSAGKLVYRRYKTVCITRQARLLDNLDGANTERCIFGKLSARRFHRRTLGTGELFQLLYSNCCGGIGHGKSAQGEGDLQLLEYDPN